MHIIFFIELSKENSADFNVCKALNSVMGSIFRNYINFFNSCFLILIILFSAFSSASDTITSAQWLRDGETIISSGGKFTLGFFTPQGSNFRYVGIWYNRVANGSVVWTANIERPISGNGGVFAIENDGNLVVMNGNRDVVWSSNLTFSPNVNSTAVLMDSGNLVLSGTGSSSRVFWQSFDHPTDSYLPDMRVSFNVRDGERRVFTSWRSASDPSLGNYTMGIDPRGSPQIVVREGVNRRWRSGHWNGLIFTGVPGVRAVFLFGFRLDNEGGGNVSFRYTPSNNSDLIKFWLNWEGMARQELWNDGLGQWKVIQSHPSGECDRYNHCGPFGQCNEMDETKCSCIEGFEPNDDDEWSRGNWSRGCRRRTDLQCTRGDGFLQVERVKLPDLVDYVGLDSVRDCRRRCLENCSCTAYAFVSGINCLMWNHELVDVQQFQEGGNALFVRLARSELGNNRNQVIRTIIIAVATVGALFLCVSIWILWRRITKWQAEILIRNENQIGPSGEFSMDFSGQTDLCVEGPQATGTELAMFSLDCVAAATDKFSHENKLGEGGFGHVYKGILPGGQEIAVKRLSKKSGQGVEEFKNEIMVIAKLQHRNLVRLLGCCVQGEEKMILYEYMPNKSLDCYLFDSEKKSLLDWSKRFNIIEGIARGLLYLHRDSRLRIIHRDLKASNILLDEEMNPKISDFGMARIFGGNQNEENTNRVVGTYGYMAPEYAMEGLFSLKSDVYSFGVLMLEIITGRRNISFRATGHSNIIGHAWDLFDKGKAIELVDPSILESCSREQVLRCIHVGVLCAQDIATYRPDMPTVVLMLEHENTILPMPRQPTFTSMRHTIDAGVLNDNQDVSSNNVTVSAIIGR